MCSGVCEQCMYVLQCVYVCVCVHVVQCVYVCAVVYVVQCVCVCMWCSVCMCVCAVCVCVWCSGVPEILEFKPNSGIFHLIFHLPPTSPTSPPSCDWGTWHLLGCKFKAFSHATAMVQVGLWIPTPLAVRKGLFSCEFLARLQEICLHGS